jgi:hypothetical protein
MKTPDLIDGLTALQTTCHEDLAAIERTIKIARRIDVDFIGVDLGTGQSVTVNQTGKLEEPATGRRCALGKTYRATAEPGKRSKSKAAPAPAAGEKLGQPVTTREKVALAVGRTDGMFTARDIMPLVDIAAKNEESKLGCINPELRKMVSAGVIRRVGKRGKQAVYMRPGSTLPAAPVAGKSLTVEEKRAAFTRLARGQSPVMPSGGAQPTDIHVPRDPDAGTEKE